MFGWVRVGVRSTWKYLKWIILISLPLNAFFYAVGAIDGMFLHVHRSTTMDRAIQHFKDNTERAKAMDWFSVPGAPGIHDFGVAPYHVPQLRDPTDWWQRLGLKRFDLPPMDTGDIPIDRFADLESLYRRVRSFERDNNPFHHFVYLSNSYLHAEGFSFSVWDDAFDGLLQYHYANPAVGNASFHFVSCPRNFLCDAWDTRGPALLHFTTERAELWAEEDLDMGWRAPTLGHLPVLARLVELPLTKPEELHLLPGVFPSPFEQMRSVTEDPMGWQLYSPYAIMNQLAARMDDICDSKAIEFPQTYGRLIKVENWLWDVFHEHSPVAESWLGLVYLFGIASSIVAGRASGIVMEYVGGVMGSFLGMDHNIVTEDSEGDDVGEAPPQLEDNFMAQMVRDFIDSFDDDLEATLNESEEGQRALEKIWDVVRRKPVAEECEGENCI